MFPKGFNFKNETILQRTEMDKRRGELKKIHRELKLRGNKSKLVNLSLCFLENGICIETKQCDNSLTDQMA